MNAEPRFSSSEFSRPNQPPSDGIPPADQRRRVDADLFEAVLRETLAASTDARTYERICRSFQHSTADELSVDAVTALVSAVVDARYHGLGVSDSVCRRVAELLIEDPQAAERLQRLWRKGGGS